MSSKKKGSDLFKAGGFLRTFRLRRDRLLIEAAEELKIRTSVLSQLETGHILLTDKFISKIRDANFLEADELRILREKAAVDVSKRNLGVDVIPKTKQIEKNHSKSDDGSSEIKEFDVKSLQEFLDNIERDFEKYEQVINGGMTQRVSQWLIEDTIPLLWRKTYQTMNHAPSEAWAVQKCLSEALVQYGVSHIYWKTSREAASILRKCARYLELISQFLNKALPIVYSCYCDSYADYLENNKKGDVSSLGKASLGLMLAKKNKIPDQKILRNFYELKAIAYAKLEDESQAEENVNNLRDLLNSSEVSPKEYRGSQNMIARVESVLGLDEFWKIHEVTKSGIEGNRKGLGEPFNMLINFWVEIEWMRKLKAIDREQIKSLLEKTNMYADEDFFGIKNRIWSEAKKALR